MYIKWDDELLVNIEKIDNQHKEIFRRINKLLDACNVGKGRGEIEHLFLFLENYISEHFGGEESLMKEHNYKDFHAHKSQHNDFKKKFLMMKSDLDKDGATLPLVISTNYLLGDWWRCHIKTTDKATGVFLKAKKMEDTKRTDD